MTPSHPTGEDQTFDFFGNEGASQASAADNKSFFEDESSSSSTSDADDPDSTGQIDTPGFFDGPGKQPSTNSQKDRRKTKGSKKTKAAEEKTIKNVAYQKNKPKKRNDDFFDDGDDKSPTPSDRSSRTQKHTSKRSTAESNDPKKTSAVPTSPPPGAGRSPSSGPTSPPPGQQTTITPAPPTKPPPGEQTATARSKTKVDGRPDMFSEPDASASKGESTGKTDVLAPTQSPPKKSPPKKSPPKKGADATAVEPHAIPAIDGSIKPGRPSPPPANPGNQEDDWIRENIESEGRSSRSPVPKSPIHSRADAPLSPPPGEPHRAGDPPRPQNPERRSAIPDPYSTAGRPPRTRKERSQQKYREAAHRREQRWAQNRLSVPYPTDGPKMTFALAWFVLVMAAVLKGPLYLALLGAPIAGLAGIQAAFAWLQKSPAMWFAGFGAAIVAVSGFFGPAGLVGGAVVAALIAGIYTGVSDDRYRGGQLYGIMVRSMLPAGLAAGGLVALTKEEILAAIGLILMISAYEAGDFIVGSGSRTVVEGPIAGFISLGVMGFILAMLVPEPYKPATVAAFAAIAAIGALAGQIFASASLPHGSAWAPALRRLDSYIITSPIWLLLVYLLISNANT